MKINRIFDIIKVNSMACYSFEKNKMFKIKQDIILDRITTLC